PPPLRARLGAGPDDLTPVAEALCVPSATPGTWVSVSLASVLPGLGLGLACKLLGLVACGARRALGVTQYDNPALRTHTRLGPLVIVEPTVPLHSRPDATFLYEITRPDIGWHVDPLVGHGAPDILHDPDALQASDTVRSLHAAAVAAGRRLVVLPPGMWTDASSRRIPLAFFEPRDRD
ncbi:MAG TPA: hypothetical protein PKA64_18675, partial [Myxococcota bacterium]|nr:hypothetical protein [Myxococcota bacterium]